MRGYGYYYGPSLYWLPITEQRSKNDAKDGRKARKSAARRASWVRLIARFRLRARSFLRRVHVLSLGPEVSHVPQRLSSLGR